MAELMDFVPENWRTNMMVLARVAAHPPVVAGHKAAAKAIVDVVCGAGRTAPVSTVYTLRQAADGAWEVCRYDYEIRALRASHRFTTEAAAIAEAEAIVASYANSVTPAFVIRG